MVIFTAFVTPFNLGFTALNNLITTLTTIRDIYLRAENEKHELEELKHAMVNAWMVYAQLFNMQLQCKDVEGFEDQLKSLIIWCYDIEDLIDKETLKSAAPKDATFEKTKKVLSQWTDQVIHPNEIKELKERFGRIVKQWEDILSKIKLDQRKKSNDPYLSRSRLPIGRDEDIKTCVQMLRSCANGEGVSIIGTCGLGKSLLARTILDSQDIVDQFSQTKLVHVKDGTFVWDDLKTEIEKFITDYITTPSKCNEASTSDISSSPKKEEEEVKEKQERRKEKVKAIQEEEKEKPKAKNMLIVFDNLLRLGDDDFEWGHFLAYVENQQKEKSINIKVIITTRNPSISQSTFTTPYYLNALSDGDSEELIKKNVEFFIKTSPSETMESIAKSVAKYCEGIPWVAERIGYVLAKQRNEDDLQALAERARLGHTSEFKEVILPQLKPCYIDMGPVLTRCLAYFSLFPINHRIDRANLAHLWVAECFFKTDKELTILQQIDKYVNELTERSILQLQPPGLCCNLQYCGQDFAMLAASGTCLHLKQGDHYLSSLNKEVRHLSLSCKLDDNFWSTLKKLGIKLRTFLSLYTNENHGHLGKIPTDLSESLSCLRVLSLTRTTVENLPIFIDELKHLQYLDVSFTLINKLPTKFPKNHPLQILKITHSMLFGWLPNKVHELTNLRYVDWEENFFRNKAVPHIGNLIHLENLPLFKVGTKEGHFISELGGMDHLQGSICIENVEHVIGIEDRNATEAKLEAEKAMLHNKCGLRRIELKWNSRSTIRDRDEGILRGLKPHRNVKELIIRNYGGEEFPEWITSSKLEKICLKECGYLPALEKMKTLKTLVLEDMENITEISCRSDGDAPEFVSFPRLESMECHNMRNLVVWTKLEEQDFPCLKELKFVNCVNMNSSVDFIKTLIKLKPFIHITKDSGCLRCNRPKCPCNSSGASTSS